MNYSDLIIEREIVANEIKNVKTMITEESKFSCISSQFKVEDLKNVLISLEAKQKNLY